MTEKTAAGGLIPLGPRGLSRLTQRAPTTISLRRNWLGRYVPEVNWRPGRGGSPFGGLLPGPASGGSGGGAGSSGGGAGSSGGRVVDFLKNTLQFARKNKGVGLVGAGGLLTASGAVPLNPAAASTNSGTQAYARAAEQKDNTEWALRHGKDIFNYAAGGLGIGAGATGLYYLLQAAQNGMKAPKKRLANPSAPYSDEEEKEALDLGATVGNAVKSVGTLPQRLAARLPAGSDPNPMRGALATTLGLAGGVAGLYGGNQLVNSIMENKQTTDAEDEVEDAKKHYYDVLTGANKRAAALDTAYAEYAGEKVALLLPPGAWDTINTVGGGWPNELVRGYSTTALLSALAAGGVGAKYMYDRTRDRSKSQNLAKARAHIARMSGTPSVWVDPAALAQVKQLANQNA